MTDLPPISRRLVCDRGDQGRGELSQDEIVKLSTPIVIVGDPGAGKSVLMETLGSAPGCVVLRAGTFVRHAKPHMLVGDATTLVIDGVDEVAANIVGGGVDAVLAKLSELDNPEFILSCRAADWRGAADRARISDDYRREATVLALQPFDYDQAHEYLETRFPTVDCKDVLNHLGNRGLHDIYGNPLTLRLIGEIAASEQQLPNSRAELLEAASVLLLTEHNARHQDRSHAARDPEELLLAAGAAFAALLLCDKLGVFVGPPAKAPNGYESAAGIKKLPMGEAITDALKTRLFQSEAEGAFIPVHRVIAEFLGAKWLAACAARGASSRRLHAMVLQGATVPTSLRGLHAWIAHFSPELAERCIEADPYGVLRYGDGDKLPLSNAKVLLTALAALSEEDPYFRSEDWSRHPASALVRPELKEEILAILAARNRHTALGALLIEAMPGSELARDLKAELTALVLDPERSFNQRDAAVDALIAAELVDSWPDLMQRLFQLADQASIRIAADHVVMEGLDYVPVGLAVPIVLARAQLTLKPLEKVRARQVQSIHIATRELVKQSPELLEQWLDAITDHARPFMRDSAQSGGIVADLVRALVVARLDHTPLPTGEQLVRWLSWIDDRQGYDQKRRGRLRAFFLAQTDLRRGILADLLLRSKDADAWRAFWKLTDSSLGLFPDEDDMVFLFERWRQIEAATTPNEDVWQDLLRIARQRDGLPEKVKAVAIKVAGDNIARRAAITDLELPMAPGPDPEDLAWEAEHNAQREAIYESHRTYLSANREHVAQGHGGTLDPAAQAYLGRCSDLHVAGTDPHKRLEHFLGESLAEAVIDGFVTAARRTDLPSPLEISTAHANEKNYFIELPLIAGVIELVRRGEDIAELPQATRASAWMAWRRTPESNGEDAFGISEPLRAAALPDEAALELFFRDSIEPQLEARSQHVFDLYLLTHTPAYTTLAAKLAAEWLIRYPRIPSVILADLLRALLASEVPGEARRVAVMSRSMVCADHNCVDLWLSAEFVVDFEARADVLREAIMNDRTLLWGIRRALTRWDQLSLARLSIGQLGFLIAELAPLWAHQSRPEGITSGDTNSWDATRFLENCIYHLASLPDAAATEMLAHLCDAVGNGHEEVLRHASRLQLRVRSDHDYHPSDLALLRAVTAQDDPQSVDDLRAFLGDRIELLRKKLEGSNLDSWVVYWNGDKPHPENYCRNRLIEQLSAELPAAVRLGPEEPMPGQARADIAVAKGQLGLPVEIKGQWHKDIWTAAVEQLDARYTHDWRADRRGIYIVLWFGNVPGKNLPPHPDGLPAPSSPEALRKMLIDRIPEGRRAHIDVHVINVAGSPDGRRRPNSRV